VLQVALGSDQLDQRKKWDDSRNPRKDGSLYLREECFNKKDPEEGRG